jgi:DNA recombination protein RmuC
LKLGLGKSVILAAPTASKAFLKLISYGWKQVQLTDEAKEITEIGRETISRLKISFDHFNSTGKSLATAAEAFH